MPDAHVLYVVTAVVVFGLVTWVTLVLTLKPATPPSVQPPKVD